VPTQLPSVIAGHNMCVHTLLQTASCGQPDFTTLSTEQSAVKLASNRVLTYVKLSPDFNYHPSGCVSVTPC